MFRRDLAHDISFNPVWAFDLDRIAYNENETRNSHSLSILFLILFLNRFISATTAIYVAGSPSQQWHHFDVCRMRCFAIAMDWMERMHYNISLQLMNGSNYTQQSKATPSSTKYTT